MASIRTIVVYNDLEAGDILSEYLGIKGIDIAGTGYSSKQAIELYKRCRPDVVILEFQIPEHDGKNAIDEIKKMDPAAKIIVISNSPSHKIEKNKIAGFFVKPYDIDEIISTIKKITVKNSK